MHFFKILKIRTRLLIIILGCSLALACLGLTDLHYLGVMGRGLPGVIYQEARLANLGLLGSESGLWLIDAPQPIDPQALLERLRTGKGR